MSESVTIQNFSGPLSDEQWGVLDGFLGHLPRPVRLVVWAAERNSCTEESAVDLGHILAERYPQTIQFVHKARRPDYEFYPLMAVMGLDDNGKEVDFGLRFVGLPAWYQINSLVGAIQAVAFRASTTEAKTRILLSRLPAEKEFKIQLFTSPEDEAGIVMATLFANLAVASPTIKVWIVMVNDVPEFALKYSIYTLPHTVINDQHHLQGVYDEEKMLKVFGRLLKS